ncbi:hypothetical protein [Gillisia marina]|uniref:hypothetical protein n=1 Tax=Gillisia marina TaxID=1167637 RepID=UPI000299D12C|nr:hypothetical protein [Gillisia marina]
MIYTLKYPSHPIERVNQVVFDFIKNSIPDCTYSRALFPDWFREVMANARAKFENKNFEDKFKDLHAEIQQLTIALRQQLFDEFQDGLDIKSLCYDKTKNVVLSESYGQNLHETLKILLKDHFFGIALRSNKTIQKNLGTTFYDHYVAFKSHNNTGRVCPFCGLHEYSLVEGEAKDDYDHWLFKSKYPIYAINFSNLVPMCHKCNQGGVKGIVDVLHDSDGIRRESFYPYEQNKGVNISVNSFTEFGALNDDQKVKFPNGYFELDVTHNDVLDAEKVETWNSVFKIDIRFNSYLSEYHFHVKEDFHEDYLPDHPEYILNYDTINLRMIVTAFKNQIGNPKRKTGVEIHKAYLNFICLPENEHMLFTFCNINLAQAI